MVSLFSQDGLGYTGVGQKMVIPYEHVPSQFSAPPHHPQQMKYPDKLAVGYDVFCPFEGLYTVGTLFCFPLNVRIKSSLCFEDW